MMTGLNEESSDNDKGKRKSRRKGDDSYESSEEEISTPRQPTVIHIGKLVCVIFNHIVTEPMVIYIVFGEPTINHIGDATVVYIQEPVQSFKLSSQRLFKLVSKGMLFRCIIK